jgi:hypothetical protein
MSTRGLYAIAILAYLLFLGGLVVSVAMVDDETTRLMAMSFLSTGLVTFTVLFAVFLSKGNASERYKELYMSEDEKKE